MTHVGPFPKQCFHQAKSSNVQLYFTPNGTIEYYNDTNTKIFHPARQDCLEFIENNIYSKHKEKQKKENSNSKLQGFGDWLAFVEATLSNDVSYLGGYYDIPTDVARDTSVTEFLIWGIGLQGTESSNSENTFEMQPLVTFCGEKIHSNSVCNGSIVPGYGIVASECCSSGQLWYGVSFGVAPGTTDIYAAMATSATEAVIRAEFGRDISGLDIYAYDAWVYTFAFAAGGTGDANDYSDCDDYPSGEFLITALQATDYNGNYIVSDKWSEGGFGECGAYVEEYTASLENGRFGLYLKQ